MTDVSVGVEYVNIMKHLFSLRYPCRCNGSLRWCWWFLYLGASLLHSCILHKPYGLHTASARQPVLCVSSERLVSDLREQTFPGDVAEPYRWSAKGRRCGNKGQLPQKLCLLSCSLQQISDSLFAATGASQVRLRLLPAFVHGHTCVFYLLHCLCPGMCVRSAVCECLNMCLWGHVYVH